MASLAPPVCEFGRPAPAFVLSDTFGTPRSRDQVMGPRGMLLAFICNHCPYVRAVIDRFVRDAAALQGLGIGVAAIMSNDWEAYPADAPEQMSVFAARHGFTFPYLIDTDQSVARAYGAVCTPDFFGYDAKGGLQYRGRLDASRKEAGPADLRRDLFEAMRMVAETGAGPAEQVASIGCSIKWRAA
ncbi:thioredoxin family protein [Paroceanicella profunda]|uniref:Thioredoxin family protein n=1 Tax=Paroceanicella profunda TaxID=2579971 RepID=A0A5B8FHS6_9RHOB|nr:thioredoxin family protein [Paroceanicella profunda]QDL92811.1 thioredoxin family protein [Paroceanicella profunda]